MVDVKWDALGCEVAVDETLERLELFGCTVKAGFFKLQTGEMVLG